MFDEDQIVVVKWHSHNKQYFIDKGFCFTKIGDSFEIPAKLLPSKSQTLVTCICDYCGKEYQTRYANYKLSEQRGKIACKNCKQLKISDTLKARYNSTSLWGVSEFRNRAKESMKQKYGKSYAMQTVQGQQRFKETMKTKYGVTNPIYEKSLKRKAKQTMYINGSVPSSKPERIIVEMLKELYGEENCFPGFPVDKVNLDCLLIVNGIKIDVEYDGLYWHKDTRDKDRKRNHWLMSLGYKVIRILGNSKDEIPKMERLKQEVDYILKGNNIGYIDMNN